MAAVVTETPLQLGPASAGIILTSEEFDAAELEEGWRYELINEVLAVTPSPLRNERDPNEELGHWLRSYQENHPQGAALDATISEETVKLRRNRRRADRVIWAGVGRLPARDETPTIVVEFVSAGRASWRRGYEAKSAEYRAVGVKEYWDHRPLSRHFDGPRFHGPPAEDPRRQA